MENLIFSHSLKITEELRSFRLLQMADFWQILKSDADKSVIKYQNFTLGFV